MTEISDKLTQTAKESTSTSSNDSPFDSSASLTSKKFSLTANIARGIAMGAADVVPGVSGGTVALIAGIYNRLINAVSHFDRKLLRLLLNRQWKASAEHVDLIFLMTLLLGIAIGFAITLATVFRLLTNLETRPFVLASFMGMILASTWILFDSIPDRRMSPAIRIWPTAIAGALVSLLVATVPPASFSIDPPLWYLFICGAIGICAMILPGISGALILLLLGVYQYLTGVPHHLALGEEAGKNLTIIIVFGSGCVIGLLSFSKILRRLLAKFPTSTFAFLMGLMIGSLPLLWPFQTDTTPTVDDFKAKIFRPRLPDATDSNVMLIAITVIVAFALVAVFYSVNKRKS